MEKIALVKLNAGQIEQAKKANGARKQITHAVVCGKYGQLFGTENYCRKYFTAWSECDVFPNLFSGGEEVENIGLSSFKSTPELVMLLINTNDSYEKDVQKGPFSSQNQNAQPSKKSWFARILGL